MIVSRLINKYLHALIREADNETEIHIDFLQEAYDDIYDKPHVVKTQK